MKKEISLSNSTHPAKKPFYKKWWFIVIIVILVIGVIGAMSGGQDTNVQNNQPSSQTDNTKTDEEVNYVEPGMYKIGTDLDAGTYLIFGTGYMALTKDSTGELDSIITNDNYINTRYIAVEDGEYFEFTDGEAYRVKDAPEISNNGEFLDEGMYRVGRDLDPGEYKVKSLTNEEYSGYYEVCNGSRGTIDSIVTNDNFSGEKYITVKKGQYLKLSGCQLILK